jgi:protein-S-isoprenylcysteine O-methyltransferase Ste14
MSLTSLRHWVALLVLLVTPPALLVWLLIHPFVRFWRRLGVLYSYFCFLGLTTLLGGGIWQMKHWLLHVEYGLQPLLMFLSGICFFTGACIACRRERQLPFLAVMGLPEISAAEQPRVLVTQGIYARVRHPRYWEAILFVLGCALFANYLSVYLAWLVSLPIVHAVILLEERELHQTFGAEFSAYCARVPRYFPGLRR